MLSLPLPVRVYLCLAPTDMRRSFDGLCRMVREFVGADPLSGDLFVFRVPNQILVVVVAELTVYRFWDWERLFAKLLRILENQGRTGFGGVPGALRMGGAERSGELFLAGLGGCFACALLGLVLVEEVFEEGVPNQILVAVVAELTVYRFWRRERLFAELLRILENKGQTGFDGVPNALRIGGAERSGELFVHNQILVAVVAELTVYRFWGRERSFAELLRILENEGRTGFAGVPNALRIGGAERRGELFLVGVGGCFACALLGLVLVEEVFEEGDGGEEVVVELEQQVDVGSTCVAR